MGVKVNALRESNLQQVFPPESLSNKRWGFYSIDCLQLLGLSIQLDLFQNRSWPETWLPSQTAVGWDVCVASSEVNIEQTRSSTSRKKLVDIYQRRKLPMRRAEPQWWVACSAQMRDIPQQDCPCFPGIWKEGLYLAQLGKQFSYRVWNKAAYDFIIAGPRGFEVQSSFLSPFQKNDGILFYKGAHWKQEDRSELC